MLKKLPQLNSKKTRKEFDFNLPVDYVVSKFYEYGYKVTHNKYANSYQSCCPICHEGKSWGRKKRCFYTPENNNIFCHNCGASLTPYSWIRKVSGLSHNEIEQSLEDDDYHDDD
jgi:predicted  nucleic acid-binding Zn ribbon protein